MKNPFYYKCIDERLKIFKVFGPGLPKNGNNIDICDEQSAKEEVAECFKIWKAGFNAGKKKYEGMEIVS